MNHETLTDDWPDEPDRSEVEAFARDLQSRLPQLPEPAVQRVEARLQEALRPEPIRHRGRRWAAAIGLAASVAIGVGLYLMDAKTPQSEMAPAPMSAPAPVRDSYPVPVVSVPAPPAPDEPLIAIDAYQGLFSN